MGRKKVGYYCPVLNPPARSGRQRRRRPGDSLAPRRGPSSPPPPPLFPSTRGERGAGSGPSRVLPEVAEPTAPAGAVGFGGTAVGPHPELCFPEAMPIYTACTGVCPPPQALLQPRLPPWPPGHGSWLRWASEFSTRSSSRQRLSPLLLLPIQQSLNLDARRHPHPGEGPSPRPPRPVPTPGKHRGVGGVSGLEGSRVHGTGPSCLTHAVPYRGMGKLRHRATRRPVDPGGERPPSHEPPPWRRGDAQRCGTGEEERRGGSPSLPPSLHPHSSSPSLSPPAARGARFLFTVVRFAPKPSSQVVSGPQ